MSEATVTIIVCDGPLCVEECRSVIPVGWITFTGYPNRHLCTSCATEENIRRQVYYQAMEGIDKRRGD